MKVLKLDFDMVTFLRTVPKDQVSRPHLKALIMPPYSQTVTIYQDTKKHLSHIKHGAFVATGVCGAQGLVPRL